MNPIERPSVLKICCALRALCTCLFVLVYLAGCSSPEAEYGPSSVGATPLTELAVVLPQYSAAASHVVTELQSDGEKPSEFYAVVTKKRDQLEFALWHSSAFLPGNRDLIGNPGGECRTFYYDRGTARVVKKELWQ